MMLKRGKAQGAMEFLMTYGWAILVVIIILSALYFLGVFSPKTVSACNIQAPFVCNDFIATDIGVTYSVGAKGINSATVTDMLINGQSCVNELNGIIINGNLNPNQIIQVSCRGINLNTKEKVSAEIVIDYDTKAGGLMHTIKGSGSGISEFATSHPPTIQLSSPSDDNQEVSVTPILSWEGNDLDDDELVYFVYLNGEIVDNCQSIPDQNCQLDSLWYGTDYNWYVIADDGDNQGQSEIWNFRTIPGISPTGLIFGWNGRISGDYIGELTGSLVGGVTIGGTDSIASDNIATDFDGTDDLIVFNGASGYFANTSYSISILARYDSGSFSGNPTTEKMLASTNEGGAGGNSFQLNVDSYSGRNRVRFSHAGANIEMNGVNKQMSFWTNQWHHFVITADVGAGSAKLYVDGVQEGSDNSIQPSIHLLNGGLRIGGRSTTPSVWNGALDEIFVWDRILSSSEVSDIYNLYA